MHERYRAHINNELDLLNTQLALYFEQYSKAELTCLNTPVIIGKWTVIQILHHLLKSEQLTLQYLNFKFLAKQEIPKIKLSNRIRVIILFLAFKSPFKFKAPGNSGLNTPENEGDLDKIYKEFKIVRHELQSFLDHIPEETLKRAWFKHPYAGRMNLLQMLYFFRVHITRHHKQIQRLLAKASAPVRN